MKPQKKVIFFDRNQAGKLHCDACGYDLPHAIKFGPELIGMPCSKCSADMLTVRDYRATARMIRMLDLINAIFGPLIGKYEPPKGSRTFEAKCHDGSLLIKQKGSDHEQP
jgi:hypothetical protein